MGKKGTAWFLVAVCLVACEKPAPPRPEPATSVAETAPVEVSFLDQLMLESSLPSALAKVRPRLDDSMNAPDPASVQLALWAAENLRWSAIQTLPETKHALVMKDTDAERGKRNCYRGTVVEIHADRSTGTLLHIGGLRTPGGQVARFFAVGSTGELVQGSPAHFCGIVTGVYSYDNTAGGTTHAAHLVGMFDLPENRQ